jgi:hypothetical protein
MVCLANGQENPPGDLIVGVISPAHSSHCASAPHDAPARKLRPDAPTLRSRQPSRSPHLQIENENRLCLRTTGKVCKDGRLTDHVYERREKFAGEFPVPAKKIPVSRNIFPVILHRELREKSLQHSSFLRGNRFGSLKTAKFPVKFPVGREFAWRRVRSALRRQPGIPGLGEYAPIGAERPANSGLSQLGMPSLRSRVPGMRTEFVESLWLTPRIFPFGVDDGGRPGLIMDCVVRDT